MIKAATMLTPKKAINKAFLKVPVNRQQIEAFKKHFTTLLEQSNEQESEEFHKNLIADFLKHTYYHPTHFINTKGRNDLVIHHGKNAKSKVGVLIETKKPTNTTGMLTKENINKKALQELVLYYLRERITHKNLDIKHLIVTNVYEWFIFDAQVFDKAFAQNKALVKRFEDFEAKKLVGTTTDFFYKEIAQVAIQEVLSELEFVYFDARIYAAYINEEESKLIPLYKILSAEHLLKLPFANDSNTLNQAFYEELLHIIGLTEVKKKSKKLIVRPEIGQRNEASLLENIIIHLEELNKLKNLENLESYGGNHEEQVFAIGLELAITWINRILFLKLLEAQLLTYHQGNASFAFLHKRFLKGYNDVSTLFYSVLARKATDRRESLQAIFGQIPYLNSSLFELTELENKTIIISNLQDNQPLPLLSTTVLKDSNGKRLTGSLDTLTYLISFLDAYNFGSTNVNEIQEQNKTLINSAVLGLIFEKINGYKDGSFFTPSFITMYMCRASIRQAVLQRFKEVKGWNCETINDLYDKIEDKKEANTIINSLRICDPAVGSGHFLVSALNEIIALKSDLRILLDKNGRKIRDFKVEVVNDELVATDDDELVSYNPKSVTDQLIQEMLFREKKTIIENCLFGVDLNPNSVKICQLRLWIELLKHAYYKKTGNPKRPKVLETLPNIDINIKCGNSLISKLNLDDKLNKFDSSRRQLIKHILPDYKKQIDRYKTITNREEKQLIINKLKQYRSQFANLYDPNDKDYQAWKQKEGQWQRYYTSTVVEPEFIAKIDKQRKELEKVYKAKESVYAQAFEWRYEFPEVLDAEGNFVGFDLIIGNPPYGMIPTNKMTYFLDKYNIVAGRLDSFEAFIERGLTLLKSSASLKFILPNTILTNLFSQKLREFLHTHYDIFEITNFGLDVFDDPTVHTCILGVNKQEYQGKTSIKKQIWEDKELNILRGTVIQLDDIIGGKHYSFDISLSPSENLIFKKVAKHIPLKEICHIRQCIKTGDNNKYVKKHSSPLPLPWKKSLRGRGIQRYVMVEDDLYVKYGDWLARNWKNISFYERPKIAIRETSNQLIATLDTENRYFLSSLYAIYTIEKTSMSYLKAILAILNSTFSTFYLHKIAFALTQGAFTKFRIHQLARLPIPKIDKKTQAQLVRLVNKILKAKKENPTTNTEKLESQIDQLVYQLYQLTPQEIEIITQQT